MSVKFRAKDFTIFNIDSIYHGGWDWNHYMFYLRPGIPHFQIEDMMVEVNPGMIYTEITDHLKYYRDERKPFKLFKGRWIY